MLLQSFLRCEYDGSALSRSALSTVPQQRLKIAESQKCHNAPNISNNNMHPKICSYPIEMVWWCPI